MAISALTAVLMGVAHVWIPDPDGVWACYEVLNVLLMTACGAVLYSVRMMRDLFSFQHNFLKPTASLRCPTAPPSPFTTAEPRSPSRLHSAPPPSMHPALSAPPATVRRLCSPSRAPPSQPTRWGMGTPQSLLYQRLAFPYAQAWRYVGARPGPLVGTTCRPASS